MNYSLIAGLVSFFFAVIFSILTTFDSSLDIIAGGFYGGALFGIFMAMLNDKKVEEDNV